MNHHSCDRGWGKAAAGVADIPTRNMARAAAATVLIRPRATFTDPVPSDGSTDHAGRGVSVVCSPDILVLQQPGRTLSFLLAMAAVSTRRHHPAGTHGGVLGRRLLRGRTRGVSEARGQTARQR
jgi:hypothetical protein